MKIDITTIVFDLGGVLVDWNPEYVYRDVFNGDQNKVDWFLNNICTSEWNEKQDAGRTLEEATDLLVNEHPQYEAWIRIYYDKWEKMLAGPIQETVDLLNKLKMDNKYRLLALTNWSAELFPIALERYEFLKLFEGIVVSGDEKTRKPLSKIYEILIERYELSPENCVFIDDNFDNIRTARKFGIHGIHYNSPLQLKEELLRIKISI
jgi:2-haloacid dehalogenase